MSKHILDLWKLEGIDDRPEASTPITGQNQVTCLLLISPERERIMFPLSTIQTSPLIKLQVNPSLLFLHFIHLLPQSWKYSDTIIGGALVVKLSPKSDKVEEELLSWSCCDSEWVVVTGWGSTVQQFRVRVSRAVKNMMIDEESVKMFTVLGLMNKVFKQRKEDTFGVVVLNHR